MLTLSGAIAASQRRGWWERKGGSGAGGDGGNGSEPGPSPAPGEAGGYSMGVSDLSGSAKWWGGILGPDGKIYCIPYDAPDILVIDPETQTAIRTDMGADLSGFFKWREAVLAADGKIYCIPYNAQDILIIDPLSQTAIRSNMGATLTDAQKWEGGALLSDGKIYCVPYRARDFLCIDPESGTATRDAYGYGVDLTGSEKFAGAYKYVATNGEERICCVPFTEPGLGLIRPLEPWSQYMTINPMAGFSKWRGAVGPVGPSSTMALTVPFHYMSIRTIDLNNISALTSGISVPPIPGKTTAAKWAGAVKRGDSVICIPHAADDFLVIDASTFAVTRTNMGFSMVEQPPKWCHGVLADNGMIYGVPYSAEEILIIN